MLELSVQYDEHAYLDGGYGMRSNERDHVCNRDARGFTDGTERAQELAGRCEIITPCPNWSVPLDLCPRLPLSHHMSGRP